MNIAQHSVEIEREVGNLGVMSWLSRHQPLPSANESWLGTILLVERIGVQIRVEALGGGESRVVLP